MQKLSGLRLLTSVKGILVLRPRLVRDLDATPPVARILKKVDV